MIATSQKYKDEIKEIIRKVYGKVQIEYTDPEIDQSIEIESTDNNHTSYPSQIADGIGEPSFKYASLDDGWILDNTWRLAPASSEMHAQYGFWGSRLSKADGTFTTPPTIEITFVQRPIRGLKLVGDSKRNEYAVDFTIRLYQGESVVYTETVIDNDLMTWEKPIVQINEITKMEITISKWNKPNRTIKIMEVFTSIQETYEGEDIISINLIEEKEVSQGSLPIGNISSNEVEIVLSNVNREFDTGNRTSKLYGLVKPNRKIKAWIGTESQLIPLGEFWAKDWDVPEDGLTAKTIGRDRLDRLRDETYTKSTVETNKTLYQLAEAILQDAKVTKYWIDDELKDFVVPYSYFLPVSHREALRQIATACLGQVYCDREGTIQVEGPSFTLERIESLQVAFLQTEFPAEIEIVEAYGISEEDYFRKDNPSRQSDIANHVTVETKPLIKDVEQEIYSSEDTITGTIDMTIQFNHVPCIDVDILITGSGSILEKNIYAWGADLKINASGNFTIKANGKPLKVVNKDMVTAQDQVSIMDNGLIRFPFPNNHLIQSRQVARVIADKLLQYYKDPKRDLTMEWRGNPALELGDIVRINDYIRGLDEAIGHYYITKQELEFAGYLRAKLEGRRAI